MIKDISLINLDSTGDISYSYNPSSPPSTGQKRLSENIVKRVLTLKGSNINNPSVGTNFLGLFTAGRSPDVVQELMPVYIKNITDQIKLEQASQTLSPSETLEDIILEDAKFDELYGG